MCTWTRSTRFIASTDIVVLIVLRSSSRLCIQSILFMSLSPPFGIGLLIVSAHRASWELRVSLHNGSLILIFLHPSTLLAHLSLSTDAEAIPKQNQATRNRSSLPTPAANYASSFLPRPRMPDRCSPPSSSSQLTHHPLFVHFAPTWVSSLNRSLPSASPTTSN